MTLPKLAVKSSGYGGRGYAIPGRTKTSEKTGKPIRDVYPSVTTVLKQIAKPGLHQWIADQTAAFAVANLPYLMAVEDDVAWGSLRFKWSKTPDLQATELREHYNGVKDDLAELGTNIHEWVEAEIDGFTAYPELYAVETDHMIDAWRGWFAEHEVESHNSEFTLVNDTLKVAGTADADWTITCLHEPYIDGQGREYFCLDRKSRGPFRTLVDVKSSRNTWRENGMQLAGLANATCMMIEVAEGTEGAQKAEKVENGEKVVSWWVEDAVPSWERYALLHIRPDDLDPQGELVPRFCVLKDRSEDMDLFEIGFNGALALAHSEQQLKERAKARAKESEEI